MDLTLVKMITDSLLMLVETLQRIATMTKEEKVLEKEKQRELRKVLLGRL